MPRHEIPTNAELDTLTVLFSCGKYPEAENWATRLLATYPDSGFIWKVLGAAQEVQGKDAIPAMIRAVELSIDDAQARTNLGMALQRRGRLTEAVEVLVQASRLCPDDLAIYDNIGVMLLELGKPQDAQDYFRKAVAADNGRSGSHTNLGIALGATGQPEEAAEHLRTALTIDPQNATACNAYGSTLMDQGLFDKAEEHFRRAIQLDPENVDALNNLAYLLSKIGREIEAINIFKEIIRKDGWRPDAYDNLLYIATTCHSGAQAPDSLKIAKQYGASIPRQEPRFKTWDVSPTVDRCLRIGLVSADLRNHPVGYFIEGVLRSLAVGYREQCEFIIYSNSIYFDELSERIAGHAKSWKPVFGLADRDFAQLIHDDRIDILIDLSGHTAGNRLPVFASKPAPIQITWLGYWATTGVAEIDYILADRWCLPDSVAPQFSEKVWYLPETRLCFTPPTECLPVAPLPALTNGYLTFGCFNRLEKITEEVIELWCRIMSALPSSRLILKAKQLNAISTRAWMHGKFAAHGISSGRIILEAYSKREEYLAAYDKVDLALDPFPFTGGTTTAEGLWMGVPALTLAGDSCLSRQGVGLMMNAGLPDWIADDKDDYVERAIAHASDWVALAKLRSGLREQVLNSPIYDSKRFADHLVTAFNEMWGLWLSSARGKAVERP